MTIQWHYGIVWYFLLYMLHEGQTSNFSPFVCPVNCSKSLDCCPIYPQLAFCNLTTRTCKTGRYFGETCASDQECFTGVCSSPGICARPPDFVKGYRCISNSTCDQTTELCLSNVCVRTSSPADRCKLFYDTCTDGERCCPLGQWPGTVCDATMMASRCTCVFVGAGCSQNDHCCSGNCSTLDSTCALPKPNPQNEMQLRSICYTNPIWPRQCPDGSSCIGGQNTAGICVVQTNDSASSVATTSTVASTAAIPIPEQGCLTKYRPCKADFECCPYGPWLGHCRPDESGGRSTCRGSRVGESCASDQNCFSGNCTGIICSPGIIGGYTACDMDFECSKPETCVEWLCSNSTNYQYRCTTLFYDCAGEPCCPYGQWPGRSTCALGERCYCRTAGRSCTSIEDCCSGNCAANGTCAISRPNEDNGFLGWAICMANETSQQCPDGHFCDAILRPPYGICKFRRQSTAALLPTSTVGPAVFSTTGLRSASTAASRAPSSALAESSPKTLSAGETTLLLTSTVQKTTPTAARSTAIAASSATSLAAPAETTMRDITTVQEATAFPTTTQLTTPAAVPSTIQATINTESLDGISTAAVNGSFSTSRSTIVAEAGTGSSRSTTASKAATTVLYSWQIKENESFPIWESSKVKAIVTELLKRLINESSNYSSSLAPTAADGERIIVDASVLIKNFGPVSEASLSFDSELYMTLSWIDPRLAFETSLNLDPLSGNFFQLISPSDQDSIWTPPVYFPNSRVATHSNILKNNAVVFILPDGNVIQRTRVALTTACKMRLHDYPFDTQTCSLEIALFGYFDNQVKLSWPTRRNVLVKALRHNSTRPVEINKHLKLMKFDIRNITYGTTATSKKWQSQCGPMSTCLSINFIIQRQYRFYLVDTFMPTFLIVGLALISLFIDLDAVAARVGLCITTMLTLHSTTINVRNKLPEVSYFKAIDIWFIGCEATICAVLIEFVVLHAAVCGVINFHFCEVEIPDEKLQSLSQADLKRERHVMVKEKMAKIDKFLRLLLPACFGFFAWGYFAYYIFSAS